MKTHKLKTWPEYYSLIKQGIKKFEIRKNDRNFQIGDVLVLMEYDNTNSCYTGNNCEVVVDYIFHGGSFGVQEGFVVMGISL